MNCGHRLFGTENHFQWIKGIPVKSLLSLASNSYEVLHKKLHSKKKDFMNGNTIITMSLATDVHIVHFSTSILSCNSM